MFRKGKLRGEKVQYPDGIGCCIWYPFPGHEEGEDEDTGLAWDFSFSDIDDLIAMLQEIKTAEPEIYEEEGGNDDAV